MDSYTLAQQAAARAKASAAMQKSASQSPLGPAHRATSPAPSMKPAAPDPTFDATPYKSPPLDISQAGPPATTKRSFGVNEP